MIDTLVELRAGSHLYGTSTPASDTDLKAVHLPSACDILLQRARPTLTERPVKIPGERNVAGDIDRESFSLQRFLDLVLAGQPLAIEMLFAPEAALLSSPDPLWREIQALAPRLISRQAPVFVRYCRKQAEQYGNRSARAAAARQALVMLRGVEVGQDSAIKLSSIATELTAFVATVPHTALVDLPVGEGRIVRHLDLCGRRIPVHATVKTAREMAARLLAEYGVRSLQAEEQGGVDWKALSHAVRVGQEALELLATGRLRFPLVGAEHLLEIKLGHLPYDTVAAEVENLIHAVEAATATSTLPEHPDRNAAEALVLRIYRQRVMAG